MFLQWALFFVFKSLMVKSFIYLFIFGCAGVFVAAWGLCLVGASRDCSSLFVEGCGASLRSGFSCCRALRLSSCGAWAWFHLPCGVFPEQGSNLCPLHWQAESQPLEHPASPPMDSICNSYSQLPLFLY